MSLHDFVIDLHQNDLEFLRAYLNNFLPQQKKVNRIIKNKLNTLYTSSYEEDPKNYLKEYISLLNLLKNNSKLAKANLAVSLDVQKLKKHIDYELLNTPAREYYLAYHAFKRQFSTAETTDHQAEATILQAFKQSQQLSDVVFQELLGYLDLVDIVIELELLPTRLTQLSGYIDLSLHRFQQEVQENKNFAFAITKLLSHTPQLNTWLCAEANLATKTFEELQLELTQQKHFIAILDNALETIAQKKAALEKKETQLKQHTRLDRDYIELYTDFLKTMQDWSYCVEKFSHDFYQLTPKIQAQYPELANALETMQAQKISLLQKCQHDWENTGYGFKSAMNLKLSKTPELKTWIFDQVENLILSSEQTPSLSVN